LRGSAQQLSLHLAPYSGSAQQFSLHLAPFFCAAFGSAKQTFFCIFLQISVAAMADSKVKDMGLAEFLGFA
jgi:hypothetical protein